MAKARLAACGVDCDACAQYKVTVERDFRICCKEKQINHCGECGEFPCEDYKKWVDWHESHAKAMDFLSSLRANP